MKEVQASNTTEVWRAHALSVDGAGVRIGSGGCFVCVPPVVSV